MSKITYTDKVTLNENPNVADVNKIKADNLNEIKNVVNANADDLNEINDKFNYSTEEQRIGKWIDGKPIYRKVITTTVNASGSISTGISHMDWLVRAMGTALMKDGNVFLPLNFYNGATGWNSFHVLGHGSAIQYQRGTSYEVQRTYFILEYTKTTD